VITALPKENPPSVASPAQNPPSVTGNTTAKKPPAVTRNREAKKPMLATGNKGKGGTSQTAKAPTKKATPKPPTVTGYFWREDGAGWELRKTVYDGQKRKQPYVAHLSDSAFAEMKRQHKGAALNDAIARWIAEKDAA
jgi:hypothetical protein